MARTVEQILQQTLGAQALQIIEMLTTIEALQEKVKELEVKRVDLTGEAR